MAARSRCTLYGTGTFAMATPEVDRELTSRARSAPAGFHVPGGRGSLRRRPTPCPAHEACPLPTNVGHSPQVSTTVSGTVAAWPAVASRTTNVVCTVPVGSGTVKLPRAPVCPPGMSISAPVAAPNRSARSSTPDAWAAVIVTCSRPGPLGAVATPTVGRGAQAGAGGWPPGPTGAVVGCGPPPAGPGPLPLIAAAPAPTKVGHSPQPSTTVRGTVTGWPAVACRTTNVVCWVPAGSGTVKLPLAPLCPPGMSISAPVAAPNTSDCRALVGMPTELLAASVTCSRPAPLGTTDTLTLGRGPHGGGGGSRPILFAANSVNHSAPSGPTVMPTG